MVVIRLLVKNGNSTQANIPREFLYRAGLKAGDRIAIELAEDNTVWIRRPTMRDLRSGADRPMDAEPVLAGLK